MKIYQAIKEINKTESKVNKIPFEVVKCIWGNEPYLSLHSNTVSFDNGDLVSVSEMRKALDWMVDQFGGKVKWGR